MEPTDARGRFAGRGIFFILRRDFQLPTARCGLSNDERKRRFGKLDDDSSVWMGGEQKFARKLWRVAFGAPNGLALLNFPTRLAKICRRQRSRITGGEKKKEAGGQKIEKGKNFLRRL